MRSVDLAGAVLAALSLRRVPVASAGVYAAGRAGA
jgi:hypothetical protein